VGLSRPIAPPIGLSARVLASGLAESNPVIGTIRILSEVSREHVITEDELATTWSACRDDDYGRIVRLLMPTGQRRDEVGDKKWSEVDLDRGLRAISHEERLDPRGAAQ